MVGEKYRLRSGVHFCPSEPSARLNGENLLRASPSACVHVVDDEQSIRESLADLLQSTGYRVAVYGSASEFLDIRLPDVPSCLVLDIRLPGASGLELQEYLPGVNIRLPVILMTGFGDIPMSVKAMKAGAVDFLTKPIRNQDLLDAVLAAIRLDESRRREAVELREWQELYALLTPRERQVANHVASGLMNKQVADKLSISEVTVKMHRSNAMRKLRTRSAAKLARILEMVEVDE
jgi:FixJ family two-component response regulator